MLPQKVVALFNRKDNEAREWIYDQYFKRILNNIRIVTHGSPEAYDMTSDVFTELFIQPGPFESLRKIYQFLYETARNNSLDYLEKQEVRKRNSDKLALYYQGLEERTQYIAEADDRCEYLLYMAHERLPRQCKQVFILWYTHQLKNQQIARRLGITKKTVENHKTEAYRRLKIEFKKTGGHHMFIISLTL